SRLVLERKAGSPELFQAVVVEDGFDRATLIDVLSALERRPVKNLGPLSELLERIFAACREIALEGTPHIGRAFIKEHFTYHDRIVGRFNGCGLCGLFSPFTLRHGLEEATLAFRAS